MTVISVLVACFGFGIEVDGNPFLFMETSIEVILGTFFFEKSGPRTANLW